MASDDMFFDAIKEGRGWYFVEYHPPRPGYRFATISIVVSEPATPIAVAEAMEVELKVWLRRYPVPLMVSAFDAKGDLCRLEGTRPSDHLVGYSAVGANTTSMFWRLLTDEEIPGEPLSHESLLHIYAGVPYKTSTQTRQEAEAHAREMRIGWTIVFVWAVVVPVVWVILKRFGPAWIGAMVLCYSLWKAFVKALKLLGKLKESPRELEIQEEERRMRHHHYHCERNPEAFFRLKMENFDREERERIQNEAKALKATRSRC
jgi:hypothetical protein